MYEHLNVFACDCVNLVTQAGEVSCESTRSSCPPPSCTHPTKSYDQCCTTCHSKDDKYNNISFF